MQSDCAMDTSFENGSQSTSSFVPSPSVRSIASPSLYDQHPMRHLQSPSMDSMYVNRQDASTPIDDMDDRIVLEEVPPENLIMTPSSSQSSSSPSHSRLNPSNIFCVSPPLLLDNQLPSTLKPSLPLEEELTYSTNDDHAMFENHLFSQNSHLKEFEAFDSPNSSISNLLNDVEL